MTQTLSGERGAWPRLLRSGRIQRWSLIAAAAAALLVVVMALGSVAPVAALTSNGAVRSALARELDRAHAPRDVVAFYHARGDQPLWVETTGVWPFWIQHRLRPEASQILQMASEPAPGPRGAGLLTLRRLTALAADGRAAHLARAEVALSLALTEHVLRPPPPGAGLAFIDPQLRQPLDAGGVLATTAEAPSLARRLADLDDVNPVYSALRAGLARYRAEWGRLPQAPIPAGPPLTAGAMGERVARLRERLGLAAAAGPYDAALAGAVRHFQAAHGLPPSGEADAATLVALNAGARYYERLIEANLERARALPAITSRRYILVNAAARQLWTYENGKPRETMKVIVGAQHEQTPMMAGLIRYLVVNPYWNVPVDLVRSSLAPKVLTYGPSYLDEENMQVLADWGDDAGEMDAAAVDWPAVAAGEVEPRVRQRPGGDNMMGQVKFMLPNELGIYLHDTPDKAAFQQPGRLLSAGCVRLERAEALKTWLIGHETPNATWLAPDQRVDLDSPVPVYITYLTAAPGGPSGVTFYPDVYGRDAALLAAIP